MVMTYGRGVILGLALIALLPVFDVVSTFVPTPEGFPAFFVPGVPIWAVIPVAVFFVVTLVGCALIRPHCEVAE